LERLSIEEFSFGLVRRKYTEVNVYWQRSMDSRKGSGVDIAPLIYGLVSTKHRIFIWLAALHRLWTSDRRVRHIFSSSFVCPQEEDNVEHTLVQCPFARQVCFFRLHIQAESPEMNGSLQTWWNTERETSRDSESKARRFRHSGLSRVEKPVEKPKPWVFEDSGQKKGACIQ
jgi:hypothetical protein